MTQPRLPPRLRAALELLPADARRVADVGAGHGALSVHLAWTLRSVIATESRRGPFDELCRNLSGWDAAALVDVRQGSDLTPLQTGEVDAVVVAGMGARTVMRICATAAEKRVRWLVLQCMQGAGEVEPWLDARGWRVLARTDVVDHGRAYPTWLVRVPG